MQKKLEAVHPGEVLLEEFLKPMDISQYRLAKEIRVAPRRINEIILSKRAVTADTALRLSRYLGSSPAFWMNLQSHYDLQKASDRLSGDLERDIKPRLLAKLAHKKRFRKIHVVGPERVVVDPSNQRSHLKEVQRRRLETSSGKSTLVKGSDVLRGMGVLVRK